MTYTLGRSKSRTYARVKVRTPGGNTVTHYRRKKPARAHCGECGSQMLAVPRKNPIALNKLPKSQKRPSRPYGGNLCSKCMRTKIIQGIQHD